MQTEGEKTETTADSKTSEEGGAASDNAKENGVGDRASDKEGEGTVVPKQEPMEIDAEKEETSSTTSAAKKEEAKVKEEVEEKEPDEIKEEGDKEVSITSAILKNCRVGH